MNGVYGVWLTSGGMKRAGKSVLKDKEKRREMEGGVSNRYWNDC
jgi:hypothetical protein